MSTQSVSNFTAKLSNFKFSKFEKVANIKDSKKNIILQNLQFNTSKKVQYPNANIGSESHNLFKIYLEKIYPNKYWRCWFIDVSGNFLRFLRHGILERKNDGWLQSGVVVVIFVISADCGLQVHSINRSHISNNQTTNVIVYFFLDCFAYKSLLWQKPLRIRLQLQKMTQMFYSNFQTVHAICSLRCKKGYCHSCQRPKKDFGPSLSSTLTLGTKENLAIDGYVDLQMEILNHHRRVCTLFVM